MPNQDTSKESLPPIPILVVDPDPESLRGIMEILDAEGCLTRGASNQEEALAAASSLNPGIILLERSSMDSGGPGACQQLKAAGSLDDSVRLIMMSEERTSSDDVADGLEAGADAYLSKPFSARELLAHVRKQSEYWKEGQRARDVEASFRALFENAPEAIVLMKGERFSDANQRALEVYGCWS